MSSRRPIDEPTIPLALCTDLAPERIDVPTPTIDMVRHLRAASTLPDEGRYTLEGPLGVGGMGEVLAVHDTRMRRTVAMKTLKEGFTEHDEVAVRFFREAQITAQLEHPNVVPIHDLGVDARGKLFYTMKRVHGESLAVVGRGDMSRTRRLQLFLQVCDAIAYAHAQGFVHRDLKPANVMIGDFGEVLVLDWGVAKRLTSTTLGAEGGPAPLPQRLPPDPGSAPASGGAAGSQNTAVPIVDDADSDLTQANAVLGTPTWMAPEQALGAPSAPAADQYALGAILYFLLCGEPAFKPGPDVVERVVNGTFRPPRAVRADVPAELEAVVLRAMQRDAGDRYADVRELREDVQAWLEGRPVRAYRYRWSERVAKTAARNRRPLVAAVSVAVVAAIVLATVIGVATTRHVRALEAEQALTAAAQQDATRQLADREISLALLHADLGLDVSARADLQRGLSVYEKLGEVLSPRARFARAWVEHRRPSPFLTWDASAAPVTWIWPSPDEREVVALTGTDTLTRYSLLDGRVLGRVRITGDSVAVRDVRWTDGPGTADAAAALHVAWQVADGTGLRVQTAAWSHSTLATPRPIGGHVEGTEVTVYLRAGKAFVDEADGVQAYDLATGAPVGPRLTGGHLETISEDGRRFGGRLRGSGTYLQAARDHGIWDTATGWPLRVEATAAELALSADGRYALELLTQKNAMSLVDLDLRTVLWTRPEGAASGEFVREGLITRTGSEITLRDLATGAPRRVQDIAAEGAQTRGWLLPQRQLLYVTGDTPRLYALGGTVEQDLDPSGAPVFEVDLSADGVLLAVTGGILDGRVRLLDARTGRLVRTIVSNPSTGAPGAGLTGSREPAFSPDGSRLAVADRDGHLRVWGLEGTPVADHALGHGIVLTADWGGTSLVAGCEDGTLVVIGENGTRVLRTLPGALKSFWSVAVSPDGKRVVGSGRGAGDPMYVVWDLETGAVVKTGPTDRGWGLGVAWSADGARFSVGGQAGTWVVRMDGASPDVFLPGASMTSGASWGPHGLLATASTTSVDLWDLGGTPAAGEKPTPVGTMLVGPADARGALWLGETLYLAGEAPKLWRVDFDPAAAVVVPSDEATPRAARDLDLARALSGRRQWDDAATLYARWPAEAPVVDHAAALLAADRRAEARALRAKLLAAGVSAGTLGVWLGE